MSTALCHYCEADVTGNKPHDCPFMGLGEMEKRLIDAAIYSLCGTASISSECHRDAAILLLVYTRKNKKECLDRQEAYRILDQGYRYFQFSENLPPELDACLYEEHDTD